MADCSTRIVYRQESDQLGATATLLGLTSTERAVLTDLSVGEGLWRVANRAFRVQHQMTPAEHDRYDTTAAMGANPNRARQAQMIADRPARAARPAR